MAFCPLVVVTVYLQLQLKESLCSVLDGSRGSLLLARSYRIHVAQGLTQASGMHTCLQTSPPLNKWPYPSVSRNEGGGGGREGVEGALPGLASRLPCHCLKGGREDGGGGMVEMP